MARLQDIRRELTKIADPKRAQQSQRFFKTGKGEYGEGDVFIGITVPQQRKIAHKYIDATFADLKSLLRSTIHEHRFTALEILTAQYEQATTQVQRKRLYDFYLAHKDRVNNWDLVDTSAEYIVGAYLFTRSRKPLYALVRSKNLWDRRIAIVSTFYFIKHDQLDDTFSLAELLFSDSEDLMHKAVGWMLREAGKRDQVRLEKCILKHFRSMPRTMLRYAIERFPETKRKKFLALR